MESSGNPSDHILVYERFSGSQRRMRRSDFEREYSEGRWLSKPIPRGEGTIYVSINLWRALLRGDDLPPPFRSSSSSLSERSDESATTTQTADSASRASSLESGGSEFAIRVPASIFWPKYLLGSKRYPEIMIVASKDRIVSAQEAAASKPSLPDLRIFPNGQHELC